MYTLLGIDLSIKTKFLFCFQHLGYRSFAEFNVAPTIAANPDVVKSFLLEFSEKIKGRADEVNTTSFLAV